MSIIDGDPKGRVVIFWPNEKVLILERREITCVTIAGGDLQVQTKSMGTGLAIGGSHEEEGWAGWINVVIGLETPEETDAEYEARTIAVFDSIIAEDDDIVWTKVANSGWIRVPDARAA